MVDFNPQEQVVLDALKAAGKGVPYRQFTAGLRESGKGSAVRAVDGLRVNKHVVLELGEVEGSDTPVSFIRLAEQPATPLAAALKAGVSNG